MKNYYKILGISTDATQEDIKKAFREHAKKYHPDISPDSNRNASACFQDVHEAYEILKDPKSREMHDREIKEQPFNSAVWDIAINNLKKTLRELQRGSDIHASMEIDVYDIISEEPKKKNLKYKRNIKCNECNGTGNTNKVLLFNQCLECSGLGYSISNENDKLICSLCHNCIGTGHVIEEENKCPKCDGTGENVVIDNMDVDIPYSCRGEDVVYIKGKGNCGRNGGEYGDLVVHFVEVNTSKYKIANKDDILLQKEISYLQAILGDIVEIESIYGQKIKILIKPLMQNGKTYSFYGQGLPKKNSNTGEKGFMIVCLKIKMPDTISEEEKALYQKLRNIEISKGED